MSDNGEPPGARAGVDFYGRVLTALNEARTPFLIGGAYALERYTGIWRDTKDLDIFLRPEDCERALGALADVGCHTELTFPHWLGKAYCGEYYADLIFSSGNGTARVDDEWFRYAVEAEALGRRVELCPAEEMIWSKSFVMERERYDGADIAHLLRARAARLDWERLLRRFGPHWRVLYSYLVLFGFIYPSHRAEIPAWVLKRLMHNLDCETEGPPPAARVCQGTLLSREQFLVDLREWGYADARLLPGGNMTRAETELWTAAIQEKK